MPLIFPSNTLSAGGFSVDNSCRFDDGATASLTRTTETPTDPDIYTFSVWVKRGNIGLANAKIFSVKTGSYGEEKLEFNADDLLWRKTDAGAGNTDYERETDAKFRDPGAWMHILIAYDSSDGTAGDRMKVYINGVQETSFGGSVDPDSSETSWLNTASLTLYIGAAASVTQYFDGYMAELAFVDGVAHAVTDFGEFDSDSPTIWKPKDISSGITWGNNGFYLDFEDSSALGNDVSGNDNDFTVSNLDATDQCTDSPTNNFATFNPLFPISGDTLSEGNVKVQTSDSNYSPSSSSIGVASGKWYAEVKYTAQSSASALIVGVTSNPNEDARNDDYIGEQSYSYGYNSANGESYTGGTGSSYGDSFAVGDIIGITLNLDDNELIFYKNGTVQNSGTALSITAAASTTSGFYYFAIADTTTNYNITAEINFGNPSFTGTDQDDDNGYGSFEYDPPSGFLALCTKNLGSDGG